MPVVIRVVVNLEDLVEGDHDEAGAKEVDHLAEGNVFAYVNMAVSSVAPGASTCYNKIL